MSNDWIALGLCRKEGNNPDDWDMAADKDTKERVVAICASCPVIAQCFEDALRRPPYDLIQAAMGWRHGGPVDAVTGRRRDRSHRSPVKVHSASPWCYARGCRLQECIAARDAWRKARRDKLATSA